MPINFYVIVFIQFCIFCLVYKYYKRPQDSLIRIFFLSAVFGLIFGSFFDVVNGLLRNFTYNTGADHPIFSSGLTFKQLILNDIFSYGLAVATGYFFISKADTLGRSTVRTVLISLSGIISLAAALAIFVSGPGLIRLFASGFIVIGIGELLMLLLHKKGPFVSMLLTCNYKSFLVLWFQVILLAIGCEAVNYFFPFWEWLPGSGYSHVLLETLVIICGYMVVFHPILIFWQLYKKS